MEIANTTQPDRPIWGLAVTWAIMPVMLTTAGAGFSPSENRPQGAALASGSTAHSPISAIIMCITTLIAFALIVSYFRPIARELSKSLLVLSLLGLTALSLIWTQDMYLTMKGVLMLSISTLFIYWIRLRFSAHQQMQLMIITGSIVAALSIVAAVFFPSVGLDHDFSYAWQGVCYSKNQFGRTILFLLTPGIHYDRKARGSLWIRSVYIPFMAFLIIMSHSASALVLAFAYLCLAFLVGIVARFSKRELPLLLLSSGILLAILAPLLLINSDSILNLVGRDSSLSGRTVLWKALSLSVAKRPLLGYGYQAFWAGGTSEGTSAMLSTYSAMHWMANYAHSGYLATLLEDGLIGLGMIVLLIGMGIRDAMSCMVRLQEQRYIHWYLGIIFLTILYNVDEITFLVPFYLPWMMLILAVTSLSTEAKRIRIEKLA